MGDYRRDCDQYSIHTHIHYLLRQRCFFAVFDVDALPGISKSGQLIMEKNGAGI